MSEPRGVQGAQRLLPSETEYPAQFRGTVSARPRIQCGGKPARHGPTADWLLVGFDFGYLLMSHFSEPVSGRVNYSGPEFSVCLSYLWGG